MKVIAKSLIILLFLLICLPDAYSWRSFSRYHLGSDANGIGGAYVADASSETAMLYNPGGLGGITNRFSFTYEVSSRIEIEAVYSLNIALKLNYFPFFALFTSWNNWKFGVSMATLFSSIDPADGLNIRSLKFTLAYPVMENLSIGAGIGPLFAWEGSGYGISLAYNLGLLWKLDDKTQLGLSFQSPFDLNWTATSSGLGLSESYPLIVELGGSYALSETMLCFAELEYMNIDSIRYIVNQTNYSPHFDANVLARLHPHAGIRFLEENTGAHISLGFMTDSSYYETGSKNQYFLTGGVRAYGKNAVFRISIIDALIIGIFYPDNISEEKLNISFTFNL